MAIHDDHGDKSKGKVRFDKEENQEYQTFRRVEKAGLNRSALQDA